MVARFLTAPDADALSAQMRRVRRALTRRTTALISRVGRATFAASAPLGAASARALRLFPFAQRRSSSLFASHATRHSLRFMREQRGVSLVETVLAVGILGLALTAGLNAVRALPQSA